jgi:hypothetical protein
MLATRPSRICPGATLNVIRTGSPIVMFPSVVFGQVGDDPSRLAVDDRRDGVPGGGELPGGEDGVGHYPVDRRRDVGVVEVDPRALVLRQRLLDLRIVRVGRPEALARLLQIGFGRRDSAFRRLQLGAGPISVCLRGKIACRELQRAFGLGSFIGQVCLGVADLGGCRIRTFRPSGDQCLSELVEPCAETT